MNVYLITYDLKEPGQKYDCLYKAIEKAFPNDWHCLNNIFIVKSQNTSKQIRDYLLPCIDSNDKLLVVKLATGQNQDLSQQGLPSECSGWLFSALS